MEIFFFFFGGGGGGQIRGIMVDFQVAYSQENLVAYFGGHMAVRLPARASLAGV